MTLRSLTFTIEPKPFILLMEKFCTAWVY